MNASHNKRAACGRSRWVVAAMLAVVGLAGVTGCYESVGYGYGGGLELDTATLYKIAFPNGVVNMGNVASYGGIVSPWYTGAAGLPAFPW